MSQKQRILDDLLKGDHVDMLSNLERYGTSLRSRISDLKAEGYPIEDYFDQSAKSGARYKVYYLPASYLEKRVAS